jgi:hypothetical protein
MLHCKWKEQIQCIVVRSIAGRSKRRCGFFVSYNAIDKYGSVEAPLNLKFSLFGMLASSKSNA